MRASSSDSPPSSNTPAAGQDELLVCQLGQVDYRTALEVQHTLRDRRQAGELPDLLLLLEHPPVYTLGRRSEPGDLPFGEQWCRAQGIDVVTSERGGRLTYHGPGQLVGYPIMRVPRVRAYVTAMERAIVAALAEEGLAAAAREGKGFTGVWVGGAKIASIGVHLARGVSMHGFAVNVDIDLSPFAWAVPCGLPDVEMTSIAHERERADGDDAAACAAETNLTCFRRRMAGAFAREFGRRQRLVAPARLGLSGLPLAPASRSRVPLASLGATR